MKFNATQKKERKLNEVQTKKMRSQNTKRRDITKGVCEGV